MDPQLEQKLTEQDKKLDQIYASVEKMRKYFLWTMILTIALVVLPLLGLIVAIPSFLSNYSSVTGL